jgi:hypothetical protein
MGNAWKALVNCFPHDFSQSQGGINGNDLGGFSLLLRRSFSGVRRVKVEPRDRALASNDIVISRKTVAVSGRKSLGGIVSCSLVVSPDQSNILGSQAFSRHGWK